MNFERADEFKFLFRVHLTHEKCLQFKKKSSVKCVCICAKIRKQEFVLDRDHH